MGVWVCMCVCVYVCMCVCVLFGAFHEVSLSSRTLDM